MNLTVKVFIGLLVGLLVGLAINVAGLNSSGSFTQVYLIDGLFFTIGKLFVNALKMLVVPLVLFSLISGVVGIGDIRMLGRVGGKSFTLYIATTAIAIALALFMATLFNVGVGVDASTTDTFTGGSAPSFAEVVTNIVPANPIQAMAKSDMLSVIFYSVVFGVCLLAVAKEASGVVSLVEQLNTVMMKMVELVMHFAPYAVFCLIAKAIAEMGFKLFEELLLYVGVLGFVLLFHGFVILPVILKFLSGLNPLVFLSKIRAAQLFAFSTASSGATIPVTLRSVEKRMGVNGSVASFTVPFGATINMDGTAMMQGVATVFVANVYGIDLGLSDYLVIILMAVLASIGTAGVPGVGLVMLTMVFNQVNLPIEGIALVMSVDRLMDMIRTAVNITGDAVVTCIVAKSENKLDQSIYANPHAGTMEEQEAS
ncbi:dicarboxylate/amino acid:cation symporter [Halioxenophilus sp. WMMB6]|uniref:dicarboxylate/amino acid:cation symporter n=1 Tax=Halioxenophilus sp. WMMB6 TaxID=3073815 RepID=UPI00295F10C9|nr:dicarboxylate/amino acid:cation symporter [Halioxenophilus sp. WMMB6]